MALKGLPGVIIMGFADGYKRSRKNWKIRPQFLAEGCHIRAFRDVAYINVI